MSKLQLRSKRRTKSPIDLNGQVKSGTPLNKKTKKSESGDESDSGSSSDEFMRPSKDLKVNSSRILLRNGPSPVPDFSSIEKSIFSGVSKLSDSESDDSDFEEVSITPAVICSQEDSKQDRGNLPTENKKDSGTKCLSEEEIKDAVPTVRSSRSKGKGGAQKPATDIIEKGGQTEAVKDFGVSNHKETSNRTAKRKPPKERESTEPSSTGKLRKSETKQEKNALQKSQRSPNPVAEKKGKKGTVSDSNQRGKAGGKRETLKQQGTKKIKDEKKQDTSLLTEEVPDNLDSLNVAQLLALGEGLKIDMKSQELSDSDEEEWEEVDPSDIKKHEIPKDGVQITLDAPEFSWRRKKHRDQQACLQAEMNRAFNRVRRELQLLCHKVSLLLWLAHGIFVNRVISSDSILSIALSLIPTDLTNLPKAPGKKYIDQLLKWFVKDFECSEGFPENFVCSKARPLSAILEQHFFRKYAKSPKELTFMFVAVLRAVGVESRLVISFQPMPLKPQSDELLSINSKRGRAPKKQPKEDNESEDDPTPLSEKPVEENKSLVSGSTKLNFKSLKKNVSKVVDKGVQEEDKNVSKASTSASSTSKRSSKAKMLSGLGQKSEPKTAKSPPKTRGLRSKGNKKTYKEATDSDTENSEDEQPILSPDKTKGGKGTTDRLKAAAAKRLPKNRRFSGKSEPSKTAKTLTTEDSSDDDDFEPKPKPKQNSGARSSKASDSPHKPTTSRRSRSQKSDSDSDFETKPQVKQGPKTADKKPPVKRRSSKSSPSKSKGKGSKVLSSDDDSGKKQLTSSGFDYWVEVYLKDEERWTCVDVLSKKIDSTKEILAKATQPVCYVIAYNADGKLKDVTKRYATKFSQVTAKQRVSAQWWEKSLRHFAPKHTSREAAEDSEMNLVELDRPMPKTVGECKNHPLYVLKRHLLKFEAIYPPDSPSLGFVRNEPVYARQNVYNLHSREIWMKEAKVVRLGEQPYKIVKARPKYDRLSGKTITDLPLEVFGSWQVEDYVPPPAVDGKVPRNAYGNVELFKPTMLPKGTVHLQVPGLSRVAKKLRIDCASAVVGFDYHSGGCHPTYDGFVVCEEYVDVLMDAWNREIDESAKRREEKHEKRIYGNWRKLIRGLLIREHLKFRYDFNDEGQEEAASSQASQSLVNPEALKAARIAPDTAPLPSLFPKLMANIRARKSIQRKSSAKEKTNQAKGKQNAKRGQKAAPKKRRKDETSEEEEEESDWDSTTTEEDDADMVLLSDEDSGSELEDLKKRLKVANS